MTRILAMGYGYWAMGIGHYNAVYSIAASPRVMNRFSPMGLVLVREVVRCKEAGSLEATVVAGEQSIFASSPEFVGALKAF